MFLKVRRVLDFARPAISVDLWSLNKIKSKYF